MKHGEAHIARVAAEAPRARRIRNSAFVNSFELHKPTLKNSTKGPSANEWKKIHLTAAQLYMQRMLSRRSRGGGAGSKRGTQKTKKGISV